jgi:hypothetical protein
LPCEFISFREEFSKESVLETILCMWLKMEYTPQMNAKMTIYTIREHDYHDDKAREFGAPQVDKPYWHLP